MRKRKLGIVQQLRNAVVASTGMGKDYARILPLLRQGCLLKQKIMHYGLFLFLKNACQDALQNTANNVIF